MIIKRIGALLVLAVIGISSSQAEDELPRDKVIDLLVAHTIDTRWECSGDYSGCSNLRAAFPRFFRRGEDLVVESLVRIDHRNLPLHRAALLYQRQRWDEPWRKSWEFYFHIEHYPGLDVAFPMAVQCQLMTEQQFRCRASEGAPHVENGGLRTYELTWYR